MNKLPDTLHELLRVALDDLDKVAKMPGVKIDMSHWVTPTDTGLCFVCLAGAVMINKFSVLTNEPESVGPSDLNDRGICDQDTVDKLHALDDLRAGRVYCALTVLNRSSLFVGDVRKTFKEFPITPFSIDKELWRRDIEEMYMKLKEFNV